MRALIALKAYIERRLEERTTWTAIGAGVTGAAALPAPYSWLAIGVAVAGTLIPSSPPPPPTGGS